MESSDSMPLAFLGNHYDPKATCDCLFTNSINGATNDAARFYPSTPERGLTKDVPLLESLLFKNIIRCGLMTVKIIKAASVWDLSTEISVSSPCGSTAFKAYLSERAIFNYVCEPPLPPHSSPVLSLRLSLNLLQRPYQ